MKKIAISLIILTVCLTGCGNSNNTDSNQTTSQQANAKSGDDRAVLTEYHNLIFGKDADAKGIAAFIKSNADVVSAETASQMILQFEDFQENKLAVLEDRFNTGFVQKELMEQYMTGADINDPNTISQSEIKALVEEAKNSGYKIVQATGICYPIINYTFYQAFGENITPEVLEYISIRVLDTEQPPLNSAALAISWDELIARALRQELFLENFDGTKSVKKLKNLYQTYERLIFFGSDKTPLFDPDTGILKEDVKAAFEHAAASNKNSMLTKKIKGFLTVLKKSNYCYTDGAEQFREDIKS